MNTFEVHFFSPDDQVSFSRVISLSVESIEGELMILAHHSPYLIYLLPGVVTVKMNSRKEQKIVVDKGVLEVAGNSCSIVISRVQVFDCAIYDEESCKSKRVNM